MVETQFPQATDEIHWPDLDENISVENLLAGQTPLKVRRRSDAGWNKGRIRRLIGEHIARCESAVYPRVGMHEFPNGNVVALHNAHQQGYSRVGRMTPKRNSEYDQCPCS